MRLNNYLNENAGIGKDEIFDLIRKDCKPFLKELSKCRDIRNPLLSGRKGKPSIFKGRVRKDRVPKDTPIPIHNYIDDFLEEMLGVRPRSNSVFCTTDFGDTVPYGSPYTLFPIGKYRLVYNPDVNDLWNDNIKDDLDYWYIAADGPNNEEIFDEWEMEYGEGNRGQYVYDGMETDENIKEKAAEFIVDEKHPGLEVDDPDEYERIIDNIMDNLEWEPEVSEEDFVDQKTREMEAEADHIVDRALSDYKIVTKPCKPLNNKVEIMLMCDEYYAIDYISYKPEILEFLNIETGVEVEGK